MEPFEQLVEKLNDGDESIRREAVKALGELGDPRAAGTLINVLKNDGDLGVGEQAEKALGKLGKPAVGPLIKHLSDKTYYSTRCVRCCLARALGEIGDSRAVEPLVNYLSDKYWAIRYNSAIALGELGDPRAIERLIKCLNDKHSMVGNESAIALEKIGDPRAAGPLASYYLKKHKFDQSLINFDFINYQISKLMPSDVEGFIEDTLKKLSDPRIIDIIPKIKGDSYDEKFDTLMIASLLLDNEEYFNFLINQGKQELKDKLMQETGFSKYYHELPFIESIIKFQKEKDDENIPLLEDIIKKHKTIENWMYNTKETKELINKMRNLGFNTDLYISSGETILEQKAEGKIKITDSWEESLENIINGITKENKYSIPNLPSKKLYSLIKEDYIQFKQGNKESAQSIVNKLLNIIEEKLSNNNRRDIVGLHDYLSGLKNYIKTGNKKGTKLIAKVWKRYIPEDLYDNERLSCCIFKPRGASNKEIPLFLMDPKTTMLQIWNDVLEYSLGAATLYAGMLDNKRAILLDTSEAGHSIYNILGVNKTKQFILNSLIKFSKKSRAEKLVVYNCDYGKAKEFVDFVKKKYELQEVEFKAIDEDEILRVHSLERKHHYTDAFGHDKVIKGKLDGYVIDLT